MMAWIEDAHPADEVDDAPQSDGLPGLLRVSEVAAYLRKSRRSITRMIARGELPCIRFGGTLYIPEAALISQIDAQIMERLDGKRRRSKASPETISINEN